MIKLKNIITERNIREVGEDTSKRDKTNNTFTYVPFNTFWDNFINYILDNLKKQYWIDDEFEMPSSSAIELKNMKSFLSKNYKQYMIKYASITWKNHINDHPLDQYESQPGVEDLGTIICKDFRNNVIIPMMSDIENNIWDEFVPAVVRTGIYTGVISSDKWLDITLQRIDNIIYFINDTFLTAIQLEGTSQLKSKNTDWGNGTLTRGYGYMGQGLFPENIVVTNEDKQKLKEFIIKKFE